MAKQIKGNSKAQSQASLYTTALMACFYLLLHLSVEQNNEKKLKEDSNTLHVAEAGKYHHKQIIANHHSPHSQSHDLYHWFLSGRQIWMACKTLGRKKNVHILNIVRKFSSIMVFEASQALLQDVYNEFTWLIHTGPVFFFSWMDAVTHIGTFVLSKRKHPWLLPTEVWSPESQRRAHHLYGTSEIFLRVIAKPEFCHPRINYLAFLPWKMEAKQRKGPKKYGVPRTDSRYMLLTLAWIDSMFAVWVQNWALSHNSSLGNSSSTRTPFQRPFSPTITML